MLAKRIIPCLDVKNGETVKGTNFVNLRSAGDPVELGKMYSDQGADELVYLDITASHEGRKTFTDMVTRVAQEINIPFTVGGGINALEDVERMLAAEFAVLVHFKSVGVIFLVLGRVVVSLLALAARQCDLNSHFGTSRLNYAGQ